MKCCYSRLLCILLTCVLSGILAPVSLLAQAPAVTDQAQPQDQTPTQDQQQDRQQQEDKASQEIINRNHLPDTPSATKPQIQEETMPAAQQPLPKAPTVEPSGTAAAQAGKISGSAGSRPAGAAIAPAKQRQVRSLVIKLGALAGAGIALGTVAALSKGTSPKPPGAQ